MMSGFFYAIKYSFKMNYNLIYNVKPEIPENNDRELFPLITEDLIVTGFAERKFYVIVIHLALFSLCKKVVLNNSGMQSERLTQMFFIFPSSGSRRGEADFSVLIPATNGCRN